MTQKLQCRFCSFSTVRAYKTKEGKFRGVDAANQRLQDHVFMCHPEEWAKIEEYVREEEEEMWDALVENEKG